MIDKHGRGEVDKEREKLRSFALKKKRNNIKEQERAETQKCQKEMLSWCARGWFPHKEDRELRTSGSQS